MATSYSVPINEFFSRVEKDKDFFQYFNLSDGEAMELANKRAEIYLFEACAKIMMMCQPTVNFSNRDDDLRQFNFDLTPSEILLISSLMYEFYLDRDVSYIKLQSVNYAPTALRVFDPSNARSTFLALYNFVHAQNETLIDVYKNTDRLTGTYNSINFAAYEED